MSNLFKTILVPEAKAEAVIARMNAIGQSGMFEAKVAQANAPTVSVYRISSGFLCPTLQAIFVTDSPDQDIQGAILSDEQPLQFLASQGLILIEVE